MSNIITASPEQFISVQNSELKTNSIKIAEAFGKRHDNILRDIDKILTQVSDSFGELNFEGTKYEQNNNLGLIAKHRMFNLTKDGFMLLVMSFTGKKAMTIKEAYITAFNLMQSKIFPPRQLISSDRQNDINRAIDAISSKPWVEKDAVIASIKEEFDISGINYLPDCKYSDLMVFLGTKGTSTDDVGEYQSILSLFKDKARRTELEILQVKMRTKPFISINIVNKRNYIREVLASMVSDGVLLCAFKDDNITNPIYSVR